VQGQQVQVRWGTVAAAEARQIQARKLASLCESLAQPAHLLLLVTETWLCGRQGINQGSADRLHEWARQRVVGAMRREKGGEIAALSMGYEIPRAPVSKCQPPIYQAAEARPSLSPTSCAPGGAILDPARQRRLLVRRGIIDPDEIDSLLRRPLSDGVTDLCGAVKDGYIPQLAIGFFRQESRNQSPEHVVGLVVNAARSLYEGNRRLPRRIVRLISALLAEHHLGSSDNPAGRPVIQLQAYIFHVRPRSQLESGCTFVSP
jgi:hypothetical protein